MLLILTLLKGLEDLEPSPATSVSVSTHHNEALRTLEERRMQLERDLQTERSAREAEVTALNAKNSELERQLAEYIESKANLAARHKHEQSRMAEDHKSKTDDLQAEIDRLSGRVAHLSGEMTMQASEATQLRQQLQDAQEDTQEMRKRLEEEEVRSDHLEKRKQDLLQTLNERDRLLRDHRSEAELDRATLEKELAEAREKLDALERDSAAQLAILQQDVERIKANLSVQQSDTAELQNMCDERDRSIAKMMSDSQATDLKVLTLLRLCQSFYSQCEGFLVQFVKHEVPKAPASGTSTTLPRAKAPAATFSPSDYKAFDGTSLDRAIEYLEGGHSGQLWELAKQQCDYCIFETKNWQKQCKRYKERMDKALATSKDKIAFRSFHTNDLALFLPTKNATERVFAAFNFGKPNHFLKPTGRLIADVESKEWIVARITSITEGVADVSTGIENNPYLLRPGSKYCMLEAEAWPTSSSRHAPRTRSSERKTTSPDPAAAEVEVKNADTAGLSPEGAFVAAPADLNSSPVTLTQKRVATSPTLNDEVWGRKERPLDDLSTNTTDRSAVDVNRDVQETATRALLKPAPLPVASSLSSSRPKDLPIPSDWQGQTAPPVGADASTNAPIDTLDTADEEPAFLPPVSPAARAIPLSSSAASPQVIPRTSLTAGRQQPNAFSRSFGSSNGSGGSSGLRKRLSSSSFFTPSKALATVAASPGGTSSYMRRSSSSTSPTAASTVSERTSRYTQTVGRYTGRNSRNQTSEEGHHARRASASGASMPHSSARDLLRSFTASSLPHGTGT